jgi:hypothetical protein
MAGSLHIVPVQATVKRLYSSGVAPQLTKTAGTGYIIVPGFQLSFLRLIYLLFYLFLSKIILFGGILKKMVATPRKMLRPT